MDYDFSFFLVAASLLMGLVWGGYACYTRFSDGLATGQQEPVAVEIARSFFPIVLIVLILRSFLVEPFRIPSGSMMPTLLIGDFILVNKFTYGVRLPVLHTKIMDVGEPERGDIVVFRYPKNPKLDYIKRIIGLPGDRIAYYGKQVYVNGNRIKLTSLGRYSGVGKGRNMTGAQLMAEDLPGVEHSVLIMRGRVGAEGDFEVPEGHYFVMGDNRDNSNDSRYWGTVPEANLVGKAFFVWMNWDWDNEGIGFNRLGTTIK